MEIMPYESPIGRIYCIFSNSILVRLSIGTIETDAVEKRMIYDHPFRKELDGYFSGSIKVFSQRVSLRGCTRFQMNVLTRVLEIPYGEVITYKELSISLGLHKGFQAIGNALCKNPIPIVIPCHRVIGSDGSLKGYSSGIEIKRWLIKHEKQHTTCPY